MGGRRAHLTWAFPVCLLYAQMSRGGDAEGKPRYQTLARGLSVLFFIFISGGTLILSCVFISLSIYGEGRKEHGILPFQFLGGKLAEFQSFFPLSGRWT